jgi:MFS family permease
MTNSQQHIGIAPLSVQEVYDTSSISTVSVHASAAPGDDTDHVDDAPVDEAALVSKITWRLIPCIGWLYMLSFLDRVNLANVHGTILGDLKLSDTDYSNAVSIFFLGYCLFEIPSNLIMQRVQPRIWIARIMITWGAITCALAACTNRDELIVGRFFLGVAEAGFFPGMVFYLTSWFSPDELSSRIAMFFSTSAVAGVVGARRFDFLTLDFVRAPCTFISQRIMCEYTNPVFRFHAFLLLSRAGGLIAYGVLQMEGTFGLHGWQLLFLFEGIPSVLSGVACLWMLPNEPEGAAFLTRAEQRFATERLRRVHAQPQSAAESAPSTTLPASKKEISWADMRRTLTDWRVWALSVLYLFVLITLYSLSFFLPAIIGQVRPHCFYV